MWCRSENFIDYTYRYLETDDLDQYNALLRYTFQVTEDELTATGWKDDEITYTFLWYL